MCISKLSQELKTGFIVPTEGMLEVVSNMEVEMEVSKVHFQFPLQQSSKDTSVFCSVLKCSFDSGFFVQANTALKN